MPTSFNHQLDTLLNRFGFHFTKNQLNQVVEMKSISKDKLRNDVLAAIETNADLQKKLNELGLLALQLDTRQVEVFKIIHDSVITTLNNVFQTIRPTSQSLIIDAFPYSVEDTDSLKKLAIGKIYPIITDSVTLGEHEYSRLVVSTMVDKEIEESVPDDLLSDEGRELQGSNTTYLMKRKIRTQLFHVVYWSPDTSQLVLSVDKNNLSLTSSQDQLFILRQFLMGLGIDCGMAINVFGAIEPIYNAADGYVTKLGHVTTNGNPVRIPLKGRQKCLKEDNYHKAGEGGGYVHAKFLVAKKWEFLLGDTGRKVDVEVGLMGQPRMLDTAQPLSDFTISKPKRIEDFNFAIEKILFHTPNL